MRPAFSREPDRFSRGALREARRLHMSEPKRHRISPRARGTRAPISLGRSSEAVDSRAGRGPGAVRQDGRPLGWQGQD